MALADLRPAVLDLALYAGDGIAFTVHIKDEDGVAVDVSAYTWVATWRPTRSSPDTDKITLSIDSSGAASGDLLVSIPATSSRVMTPSGDWDLQGTIGAGDPTTIVTGNVTIQQDVTR